MCVWSEGKHTEWGKRGVGCVCVCVVTVNTTQGISDNRGRDSDHTETGAEEVRDLLLILSFFVFPLCARTRLVRGLCLVLHPLSGTVSLAKLDRPTHLHLLNHL